MPNLNHRKTRIQEKRKQTPRRQFVMELCSRYGMTFHNAGGRIDGYPALGRVNLVSLEAFENLRGGEYPLIGSTFFELFGSLYSQHSFPHIHHIGENENSTYAAIIYGAKNAYLSTEVIFASNVLYSAGVKDNSDMILNSMNVVGGNANVYMSNTVRSSFNIFYSKGIFDSSDIWFSVDMQGCIHCINCRGLQNASYHIDNICYPKDEYERLKSKLLAQKDQYNEWFDALSVAGSLHTNNATGQAMIDARNVENGCFVGRLSDARNVFFAGGGEGNERFYDTVLAGVPHGSDMYGVRGASGEHYYCTMEVIKSSHIFYSMYLENCSYCMGCIGLRNESYCIFNTQYTKEEWHEKVNMLFSSMEQHGTLGEFFPGSMCPHYFNDTAAALIDESFTKEEVLSKGYARRDELIHIDIPEGVEIVKSSELGTYESVADTGERIIDPTILKKVIQDDEGNVYRIIPMEYKFLKKHKLPIPRRHWFERLKQHFIIDQPNGS